MKVLATHTFRWHHPAVLRRIATVASSLGFCASVRGWTRPVVARPVNTRYASFSSDEEAEFFEQSRRLAVARQTEQRLWDLKLQGGGVGMEEYVRARREWLEIIKGMLVRERRLHKKDLKLRKTIRSIRERLDADAARPRPRLTVKERELVKGAFVEFGGFQRLTGKVLMIVAVVLLGGFLYLRSRLKRGLEKDASPTSQSTGIWTESD